MLRSLPILLLLTALLPGCRHTQTLDPADAADHARVNHAARDRGASLVLRGGSATPVRRLHVTSDSLFWIDPRTQQAGASPIEAVETVTFRRHLRGAAEGLLLGLLIGAPLGALLIDAPSGGAGGVGDRVGAALAGASSLGLWGGVIGGGVGSRVRYRFAPRQRPGGEVP